MTVTALPARNEYTASAGQTIFNYTFKIYESTDLLVYVTPAGQPANDTTDIVTGYSVSGVGNENGGSITLVTPTALNDLVTIVSGIPTDRTTDYQNNGDFRPDTVNDDLDRVVSLVKQIGNLESRTLVRPNSGQQGAGLSLPEPEGLKLLRWKGDETGLENIDLGDVDPDIVPIGDLTLSLENYAALRVLNGSSFTQVSVAGHTDAGDGGGGVFSKVASGTDNGVTVLVDAGGGVWARSYAGDIALDWAEGIKGDGLSDDTTAVQAATAIGRCYGTEGRVYLVTKGQIDYSKVYGPGLFSVAGNTFPVGDIRSSTTLNIPSSFDYVEAIETYLGSRRILAQTTVNIAAGSHSVDMTSRGNIKYEHPDGAMLTISGAGSATTSIVFDFTGRSGDRLYAIGLDGNFSIKSVSGITFDGYNYSGHANGGPTLGDGNAADPIGCKCQNGGSIEFGADVVFTFFARNGVLINEGSYCLANGVDVNNCGSDAFVSSIGSSLFADGATCSVIYGDAFFADRGGDLYCRNAVADDIRTRFSGAAGDGIAAVEGGKVYAQGAALTNVASDGIVIVFGHVYGDDITVGGAGVGCGGYGMRNQGGWFYGDRLDIQYSQLDNIRIENAGMMSSDGCISKFSVTGDGINAIEASFCSVSTGTFSDNASDGINASNCRIHATSLVEVDRNGGWGIIARRSGIVNAQATVIGGANTLGASSPVGDASSGIADSYIYI